MFVTDRLVFLHLEKTAGTHITLTLRDRLKLEGQRLRSHHRLPADLASGGRYIVGSIRNPFDWYVSLWAFGCAGRGGVCQRTQIRGSGVPWGTPVRCWPLYLPRCVINERLKPVAAWRRTYADPEDVEGFRAWVRLVLDRRRRFNGGGGYGVSPVSAYAGLMTFFYLRLFSREVAGLYRRREVGDFARLLAFDRRQNVLDAVIRTESVEEDLIRVLGEAGHELTEAQVAAIRGGGRTNTSSHRATRCYYDDETLALVMQKERFILDKYGYGPPR